MDIKVVQNMQQHSIFQTGYFSVWYTFNTGKSWNYEHHLSC